MEYATLEWVDWFNHCRLFKTIGHIPPTELEEIYRLKGKGRELMQAEQGDSITVALESNRRIVA